MTDHAKSLMVRVWRSDTNSFEAFEVPRHDSQTVLDVVSWIQHFADPTLTYRFACRVGVCGSRAMMANDAPRWTCRTHVAKVEHKGTLKIAPLRNLPVIKDLAADLDPFFERWVTAGGRFSPASDRDTPLPEISPDTTGRQEADAGIECINCAVCYAACDTVSGNSDYFGPAALQRLWTLLNDERSAKADDILTTAASADGCFNCHSMGSCTHFCPQGLDPMRAIAGLKRAAIRREVGR